jgi:chemotaxis protein MotB
MMHLRKSPEPNFQPGAPRWIVTFSDCMTLLLTFFVLLVTFSSFGETGLFKNLKSAFAQEFSINTTNKQGDAIVANMIKKQQSLQMGSEKDTLSRGLDDNLKKEDNRINFRDRKVFVIPSQEIFIGKGYSMSLEGKKKLADMAAFLKQVPDRIVISENAPSSTKNPDLGLQRAWALTEHFTKFHGMDIKRFSISAGSTLADEILSDQAKTERSIEIVLLERSIYN